MAKSVRIYLIGKDEKSTTFKLPHEELGIFVGCATSQKGAEDMCLDESYYVIPIKSNKNYEGQTEAPGYYPNKK